MTDREPPLSDQDPSTGSMLLKLGLAAVLTLVVVVLVLVFASQCIAR